MTATTTKKTPATEKAPNYTPEQVAIIESTYISMGETKEAVEKIADTLGKSTRSIIAKLSRMGLYKKPVRVGKTGEVPQKKDVTADAIGAILRLTEAETESLTKANKTALVKIFEALANSKPIAE